MFTVTRYASPTDVTRPRQAWNFVRHHLVMCIVMRSGIGVGDAISFAITGAVGYDDPFGQLPLLSLAVPSALGLPRPYAPCRALVS